MQENILIQHEERSWAALAHLSGLAGYVIPLGGVLVPIILIFAKEDSPVVKSIAKQALMLNIVAFLMIIPIVILFVTVLLFPVAVLLSIVVSLAAIGLPVIGAIKASDGKYYRYPVVGTLPF